jgi:hypothetical protein
MFESILDEVDRKGEKRIDIEEFKFMMKEVRSISLESETELFD